jgi:hypothetical protein
MVPGTVGGIQERCSFNHDVPPCVAVVASRPVIV